MALETLTEGLVAEGYAPGYARRLADELEAHVEDATQDWVDQGFEYEDGERKVRELLGQEAVLMDAVRHSGVQRAAWRRHPLLCFLVGIPLAYMALLLLLLVTITYGSLVMGEFSADVQATVARGLSSLPILLGVFPTASLWRIALSPRCFWLWPLLASLGVAYMAGMAQLNIMLGDSGQLTFPGRIQIARLVALGAAALLSIVLHSLRRPNRAPV